MTRADFFAQELRTGITERHVSSDQSLAPNLTVVPTLLTDYSASAVATERIPQQAPLVRGVKRRIASLVTERRVVAVIISCAALLAWFHLRHASIWYDEAITLLTTSGHAQVDWQQGLMQFQPTANLRKILFDLRNQDVHPPLYFCSLAIWRVAFGASLEAARSFSALFIVAMLALLFRLARQMGVRPAWVPVAIYAACSAGTWYAYDARPYAMATFLIVLAQYLAYRRSRWSGVCAAAAFATHYFAVLCVAPVLALECMKRWKTDRKWVVSALLSFGLCSVPLLWLLRVHMVARPNQYPGFGFFPEEVWALLKGSMQGVMPNTWLPAWGLAVIVGAFFVGAGLWSALKKQQWSVPFYCASFLCGFLLVAIVSNKSIMKMPSAYYLGLAAPWLALLIGHGVNVFPRVSPVLALVGVVGLFAEQPIVTSVDYRQIVGRMRAECSHCPIVVGAGFAGAVPACVLYESRGMPVFLLRSDASLWEVARWTEGRGTIFFVPTNEPPTAHIEQEFLRKYLPTRRNGYFELTPGRAPEVERASHSYDGTVPVSLAF